MATSSSLCKRFSLLFLFAICCQGVGAEKLQIALTFDDFPMGKTLLHTREERARLYFEKLEKLNIQAAFFCIGAQLKKDDPLIDQAALYEQLLANHSMSHRHLSKNTLDDFETDFEAAESYLKGAPTFRKWYRFPYLDYGDRRKTGGSERKRVAAFQRLRNAGYLHGYATINTFDWYIDHLLLKALKNGENLDLEKVKELYLSLLEEWINVYHQSWKQSLRSSFCHVLLLHQNDLNLLFLEELVAKIEAMGWEIVSPDVAYVKPLPLLARYGHTLAGFEHPPSLSTQAIDARWNTMMIRN